MERRNPWVVDEAEGLSDLEIRLSRLVAEGLRIKHVLLMDGTGAQPRFVITAFWGDREGLRDGGAEALLRFLQLALVRQFYDRARRFLEEAEQPSWGKEELVTKLTELYAELLAAPGQGK